MYRSCHRYSRVGAGGELIVLSVLQRETKEACLENEISGG